jgi:hypothetical protein
MFKRRGADKRYSPEKTIHWLSWLAQKMSQHAQSVFLIERMQPSWLQTSAQRMLYAFSVGLPIGLFFGLFFGLPIGLFFGLLLMLLVGLFAYSRDIKTFEVLKWRWKKGMLAELFLGLLLMLLVGLFLGLQEGLLLMLLVWLLVVLQRGLESEEIQTKTVSNQGIRESAKNAVILGLLFGLSFGLPIGLSFGLQEGLPIGLHFGLLFGLFFGGLTFIEHYFLRVILYRNGHIPWNYARFLDYAAERIFLRKVGGGYIFVHRLLMDYFASLEPEQEAAKAA